MQFFCILGMRDNNVPMLFLFIQYADYAKHVVEGKYADRSTHLKPTQIKHRNC